MFYKLQESVCNTIHQWLEYTGSAFRDIVPIDFRLSSYKNFKPKSVGHALTMGTKSLKALPVYSNKWCIVLQTDSYLLLLLLLMLFVFRDNRWRIVKWRISAGSNREHWGMSQSSCKAWSRQTILLVVFSSLVPHTALHNRPGINIYLSHDW